MISSPKISVVGFGYVGLTTAVCFASRGLYVRGFDVDSAKVSGINNGVVPFHEPQVSELLKDSLKAGFAASSDKIELGDLTFMTVGTPSAGDGSIDLSYIKSASEMIGKALKNSRGYHLIIVKSTVVPGTTEGVVKPIIESFSGKKVGDGFGLAVNPEFLREGSAVKDMFEPDRLVIGEYDRRSGDVLESFYKVFYKDKIPSLLRTNLVNAEFIKYANNAFLATKISFANTIANIAQRVPGADVTVIAKGIGLDNRIGSRFLNAGLGFGGSCFPKDVRGLVAFSKQSGYDPILLNDSNEVNNRQPLVALHLASTILGTLKGKRIAILGLSFKPDTDDIREAVSLPIIKKLLEEGASVVAYDPAAMENTSKVFGNQIEYAKTALDALKDADCCIIVTEWEEFRLLRPEDFKSTMKNSVIIDGRRIFDPRVFDAKVSKFEAVGLG
ncbi:MAG: UDP-glucose dehydrogenase family protein [Nitrososphaerales archaeon]